MRGSGSDEEFDPHLAMAAMAGSLKKYERAIPSGSILMLRMRFYPNVMLFSPAFQNSQNCFGQHLHVPRFHG